MNADVAPPADMCGRREVEAFHQILEESDCKRRCAFDDPANISEEMSLPPECLPPYHGGEKRISQLVISVRKVVDPSWADGKSLELLEIHHDVGESS